MKPKATSKSTSSLPLAPANEEYASKFNHYTQQAQTEASYADHPEQALTVGNWDWGTGGFGSKMISGRLTVTNAALFPIKDFTLHCEHSGNSGTVMDENTRTIYEIVPAKGKKTFHNLNMGFIASQAVKSNCTITDAKRVN